VSLKKWNKYALPLVLKGFPSLYINGKMYGKNVLFQFYTDIYFSEKRFNTFYVLYRLMTFFILKCSFQHVCDKSFPREWKNSFWKVMNVTPPPTHSKKQVQRYVSSLCKPSRNVQQPILTRYVYCVIKSPSRSLGGRL